MSDSRAVFRRRGNLLAALAAVVCAVMFAATASAGPADDDKNGTPAGTDPDKAESEVPAQTRERQERLTAVAELINAAVDPTETGRPTVEGSEGYLFLRLSLGDDKLLLYWKGDLPENLQKIISSHPEAQVEVREAPYTAIEYMDAQDQLLAAANKVAETQEGVQVVAIEHVGDLTGFKVIFVDPKHSVKKSTVEDLAPAASQLGISVDFAYVDDAGDTGLASTRQNDSYPWWGGAQIRLL